MKIYLIYSQSSTGGEPEDPNERWTSYTPQYKEFYPERVLLTQQPFQETIEVDWTPELGKKVWILVVRYQSGSTFGTSYGNWTVIKAFDNEKDAIRIAQIINKYPDDEKKLASALQPDFKSFYASWIGYFERFEGTEIHEMTIEDGPVITDGKTKFIRH